jgi:hypothetical protein
MNTETNKNLSGYSKESFREFIRTLTKDWNLPNEYVSGAESYFLMHLTACEIADILTGDGITITTNKGGTITFLPLFNRTATEAYNYELQTDGERKFWLSFRAVRYPIGTTEIVEGMTKIGNLKAYVLIQLDKKS